MSKNSAPPSPDDFLRGPPPPSYEESLEMNGASKAASPHQYTYSNPTPYQQQQAFVPPPHQTCGYSNPYQTHIQQQQNYYESASPQTSTTTTTAKSQPPSPAQMAAECNQVIIKKQKKS